MTERCLKCGAKKLLLGGGILGFGGPLQMCCPKCDVNFPEVKEGVVDSRWKNG